MISNGASHDVPPPMRVSEAMILRCRNEVEHPLKRKIRNAILPLLKARYRFRELGEGFQLGRPIFVGAASRVGRYCYIGAGFQCPGPVLIGDLCMISTNVTIAGDDHLFDRVGIPTRLAFNRTFPPTIFEADVWVGTGATIKAGLTLGRGSVIAAGAIVTRSVEPYSVVAGVPAKELKKRFNLSQLAQHEQSVFAC